MGQKGDVTGKPFLEVLPELKGQGFELMMHEVMRTGTPKLFYEVPLQLDRPGKESVGYFNFVYQPYYKEQATKAESVLIIAHEVTQQVLAKRLAIESERTLRFAVEIGQLGVFNIDLKTDIANYSQLIADWFGFTELVLPMSNILTKVHADDQPLVAETLERSKAGESGGRHDFVYRVLHPTTGTPQYLRSIGQVQFEDGKPVSLSGIIQDTTVQVLARKKLEESEERYYTLLEETTVATAFYTGPEARIQYANATMLQYWGKGREVIGKTFRQALPELETQSFPALLEAVYATGIPYIGTEEKAELRIAGDLRTFYFNFTYKALRDKDGQINAIHHTAIDVTEQVIARQKLEKNKMELVRVLEQARLSKEAAELGTFDMDLEKGTMHWDDRCRTLFGISHRETVTYERDFAGGLHPHDRERVLKLIDRLFIRSLSNGDYDVEYRTVGAEDGIVRWVRAKGKVYFDEQDKPVRFIGSVIDITEKVMAIQRIEELVNVRTRELAAANEALQKTNKELQRSNQNLEEFAHAASHDLKEPVRKIQFFTDKLKSQLNSYLKDGEEQAFGRIQHATQRMGSLIDDLLRYSHVSHRPHEMEKIDLNLKVKNVLEDLELDVIEKRAVINVAPLPVVKGYRRQLQQLFQNLISNALKYSKENVPPQIGITAEQHQQEGIHYHLITVKDNGIGFPQEYAEKIFRMFTRLHGKNEYSGTGVGLSIVKKVVENHNGHIIVQSEVGEGSVFKIYLPA